MNPVVNQQANRNRVFIILIFVCVNFVCVLMWSDSNDMSRRRLANSLRTVDETKNCETVEDAVGSFAFETNCSVPKPFFFKLLHYLANIGYIERPSSKKKKPQWRRERLITDKIAVGPIYL